MPNLKPVFFLLFPCLAGVVLKGQTLGRPRTGRDSTLVKVDSLKPAIVIAPLRERLKGDTLEYNTERIRMQPNVVVEELLRRLPGLHVDPDGTITYNGEKIQHLMLDGEEVTSLDPSMVTRNFDASKVARVQIIERKSDNAIFTGIDDGVRSKSLNLVIRETARNGYFGKLEAGLGTDGYYTANGAVAAIRDKEQFLGLGLTSNAGMMGLSSGGGGAQGSVFFVSGSTDPLGTSAGVGIPRFDAAAVHYANTWDNSEDHFAGNYQYSYYYTQPITSIQSVQTQPDSIYRLTQMSRSKNLQDQHWFYGVYDWKPNIKIAFRGVFHLISSSGQNEFQASGASSFNQNLVNSSGRSIHDDVGSENVGGDFSFRTSLGRKPGRVLSITADLNDIDSKTEGYLFSANKFYQVNGVQQGADTVDQRKRITGHTVNVGGAVNFLEPLWRGATLGLSYGFWYGGDLPYQATFNRGDGKYNEIVDSLSSHYGTRTVDNRATANIEGKIGRLAYTIGSDWFDHSYQQRDLMVDSTLRRGYSNWSPKVLLNYSASKTMKFEFRYIALEQAPSISQLAPLVNNSDPLHISLGNSSLKPAYSRKVTFDFSFLRAWSINMRCNATFISNSISARTVTDSLGRQITQPVNVNGGRQVELNLSVNRTIAGVVVGFHTESTYNRTVSYINSDLSKNDVYNGGGGISLDKYIQDKFSFLINTDFVYFDQVSSIYSLASQHYWTQSHEGSLSLFFIRNYEVNTNMTYRWQEKTNDFGSSSSVLLWGGYLTRNCLHSKLILKLRVNNMLNVNAGVSRTNSGSVNTQSSANIVGRYWMLSLTYHFDKKFKK